MEEAPPVEYSSMRKPNLASFLIQKMDNEKDYTSVMNRLRRENTTYRVLDQLQKLNSNLNNKVDRFTHVVISDDTGAKTDRPKRSRKGLL